MFRSKSINFLAVAFPVILTLVAYATVAQDEARSSRNRATRPAQEAVQEKLRSTNPLLEKKSPAKRSLQDQDLEKGKDAASPSQEPANPANSQAKPNSQSTTPQPPSPEPETPQNPAQQSGASNPAAGDSSPVTTLSPEAREALNSYLSTPRRARLGRQPRMFGDWFNNGSSLIVFTETPFSSNGLVSEIQMPTAGAGRVGKISENNHALPYDRVFVNYSYFHNAIGGAAIGPDSQTTLLDLSMERWTIGFEKTFLDGLASLETRFVLSDVPDFGHNPLGPGVNGIQASNPTMGNLAFISKFLLFENDSTAVAAGASLELPTGGDSFVQSGLTRLELENQAAFISPYIGILKKPTDSPWFANLFVQVETPLSGDGITVSDLTSGASGFLGRVNPQTNLFVDLGVGRWIYQNPNSFVSGIAMFAEAHYNAALNDADGVEGSISADVLFSDFYVNYEDTNRYEVVDLTVGLHLELNQRTKVRLGGVFPVSKDRTFDGEFGFQLTRVLGN